MKIIYRLVVKFDWKHSYGIELTIIYIINFIKIRLVFHTIFKVSHRLTSHPVMITVADMAAARRWLKIIKSAPHAEQLGNMKYDVLQPTMEINPR